MTTARQSKLKFLDSVETEEGDYECMICYTELSPNSSLAQTACCLKLACTDCMLKSFYHSLMARDTEFKCPMCRGIIMENPGTVPQHVQPHDDLNVELARNLESIDLDDLISHEEADVYNSPNHTYQTNIAIRELPFLPFNPAGITLEEPVITESTARYTTWSHVKGKVIISYFTGAPNTILIKQDEGGIVTRWTNLWEIAGIGITPFNPANPERQSIYIIIISKPINHGTHRHVSTLEINTGHISVFPDISEQNAILPNINHKANIQFNPHNRSLTITDETGVTLSQII